MKRLFTEIEKGEYTMILFVDETECKDYFGKGDRAILPQ